MGRRVTWIEHAADPGCPLDDRAAVAKANPALAAGILHADVLEVELKIGVGGRVPGVPARAVGGRGRVVDGCRRGVGGLPAQSTPPVDGAEVVLGLAGTWTSSVAMVGATFDGAVFVAWAADQATDDEIDGRVGCGGGTVAGDRGSWSLHGSARTWSPACRPNGCVEVWPNRVDVDVASSTEWRRAIVEGRVAHDHHPVLAAHVAATVARATTDGSLRLSAPSDGRPVDAARAARMAWWSGAHSRPGGGPGDLYY